MEGLVFLIVIYVFFKLLTGGLRRLPPPPIPKAPAGEGDEPRLPHPLAELVAAWQPPPPTPARRAPVRKRPPSPAPPAVPERAVAAASAPSPAPPAVRDEPAFPALAGLGPLTHPQAALQGIILAEIFGPPRCRRPHRPV